MPVIRTFTTYVCPYCNRGFERESECIFHEKVCIQNPSSKSCFNCYYYAEIGWTHIGCYADYEKPDGTFDEDEMGSINWDMIGKHPRIECPKWKTNKKD